MLRMAWVAIVAIVATLIVAPLVTLIGIFRSHSPWIDRLIRQWARSIVNAAGLRIRVEGTERIDPATRYIFVANHGSYLDIPVLFVAVPQPLRFMAKVSLFKVPVFGQGLRAAGFIPIDRKDRSKAKDSLDLAAERIRKGNSIIIFPEEHRTLTGELQAFQRGAFVLAMRGGLPLVPMAIHGTYQAFPPRRWAVRSGPVRVTIGEPIQTAGLSIRKRDELMSAMRSQIAEMLAVAEGQP